MPARDFSTREARPLIVLSDSETDTAKKGQESATINRKRDRNSGRTSSEKSRGNLNVNSYGKLYIDLVSDDDEPTRSLNPGHTPGSKEPSSGPPLQTSQSTLPIRNPTPQRAVNSSPLRQSSSGPKVKFSPPSAGKVQHITPQKTRRSFVEDVFRPPPPLDFDETDDVDEEEPMPISQKRRASPATPSKSSRSHHGSQKSSDAFTVGTDSPLETRIKPHLRKKDQQFHRNESPREVMARRSESVERPRNPPPSIQELAQSLKEFEKEMKEDHARDVRWLLNDAQDAVEETQKFGSKFITDDLPFASLKGVQLRSSAGTLVDRWDHYVSRAFFYASFLLTKLDYQQQRQNCEKQEYSDCHNDHERYASSSKI
jgi:hypothetical protein